MTTLKERLDLAMEQVEDPKPTQAELARLAGVKPPSVHAWFSGKTKALKGRSLLAISRRLGVSPAWLEHGVGPMRPSQNAQPSRYTIAPAGDGADGASEITMLDARGSCGGGSVNWDAEERQPLIKEAAWFKRFKVRARDAFAVWAYGDSMAEYIVDGDIVIFDKSKVEPKSGEIFLIDHPDGLRIKRMRREIDGTWVLESINPDKRRFPDERIGLEHADLLKIRGQFVYRQGG